MAPSSSTSTALALDSSVSVTNLQSVSYGALVILPFDAIYATYPDTVTEVYTYKLSGVTVNVVTVIYSDESKEFTTSVVRT